MAKELKVEKSIEINTSPSVVWNAITNSGTTKKYMFNAEIISDWKAGSSIVWRNADNGKIYVKGEIIRIAPQRFLQTSDFNPNIGLADIESNYSMVTYELNSIKGRTLLKITESNFNGDEFRYKDSDKFWETVLIKLRDLLENKY